MMVLSPTGLFRIIRAKVPCAMTMATFGKEGQAKGPEGYPHQDRRWRGHDAVFGFETVRFTADKQGGECSICVNIVVLDLDLARMTREAIHGNGCSRLGNHGSHFCPPGRPGAALLLVVLPVISSSRTQVFPCLPLVLSSRSMLAKFGSTVTSSREHRIPFN
jgi:hypothetical protein